ncbi:MAG TPA: 4Fe-4S dicluster domain-containing protein [Syntrophales bacterium]|nr:4Fe-4S dicluster domain-containing protein [Syntrophales bacterium]
MGIQREQPDLLESSGGRIHLDPLCSRRQTLKWGGLSIIGLSMLGPVLARGETAPLIIMEKAGGLVVADTALCVGCGRCELACTEFNDGRASPSLSRIKVDRNLNFGPAGAPAWREGEGNWGDGLIVQDLCKQCPHPVPCADMCPEDAIVLAPGTGARVVNLEKCTGCKDCLKACPWEMISFDTEANKATKCHLCGGKPKCVEACPAGALSYVVWQDLTEKVPARIDAAALPLERSRSCTSCHVPGQRATLREGFRAASGVKWIDLAGSILIPVAAIFVVIHGMLHRAVKR